MYVSCELHIVLFWCILFKFQVDQLVKWQACDQLIGKDLCLLRGRA